MRTGFVVGKFMPLHQGHLAMIEFARKNCDLLYIIVCFTSTEPIPGEIRLHWLNEFFAGSPAIKVMAYPYDERFLPNTSASSREASQKWAVAIKNLLPTAELVVTSEPYGD